MQSIKIVEYTTSDYNLLVDYANILQDTLASVDTLKKTIREAGFGEYKASKILQEVDEKDGKIFFAEIDGKKPAILVVLIEKQSEGSKLGSIPATVGYIDKLVVMPEYRGKGIGSFLLEYGEKYLISKGCNFLNISVFADNKNALDLYLKNNYKIREYRLIKKV